MLCSPAKKPRPLPALGAALPKGSLLESADVVGAQVCSRMGFLHYTPRPDLVRPSCTRQGQRQGKCKYQSQRVLNANALQVPSERVKDACCGQYLGAGQGSHCQEEAIEPMGDVATLQAPDSTSPCKVRQARSSSIGQALSFWCHVPEIISKLRETAGTGTSPLH